MPHLCYIKLCFHSLLGLKVISNVFPPIYRGGEVVFSDQNIVVDIAHEMKQSFFPHDMFCLLIFLQNRIKKLLSFHSDVL